MDYVSVADIVLYFTSRAEWCTECKLERISNVTMPNSNSNIIKCVNFKTSCNIPTFVEVE